MVNRITGALIHQVLRIARTAFDGAEDRMGRPFTEPDILVPHTRSRRVGWTHYGLMIPDLPEPHRYLTIMSLIGGTGSLAFDHDHALVASPRPRVGRPPAPPPPPLRQLRDRPRRSLPRGRQRADLRPRTVDHRRLPVLPGARRDRRLRDRAGHREHRQGVLVLPQPRLQAP